VTGVVGCADAVTPFDCTTANGGSLTVNANGRFSFRPAAGSTANDSFQYVLSDNGLPAPASSNVTVSLTFVGNRIWFVKNNAAAMWELLGLLASRIRRSTGHIEDLVFLDLPGRVAKCLIDQNEILGQKGVVALTQEDVASFVGATRVAVNRVLVDLERRGALKLGRGSILIANADLLRKEIRY